MHVFEFVLEICMFAIERKCTLLELETENWKIMIVIGIGDSKGNCKVREL